MGDVLVLVEGQTEETVVRDVIAPHLEARGVFARPVVLATKRMASGGKFRGGATSWAQMRDDLRRLLRDTHLDGVTTMWDLYGLPVDVPGVSTAHDPDARRRAEAIEEAIAADLGDTRLRPYIQLHEFEALVLADPTGLARRAESPVLVGRVKAVVQQAGGPELVNDGPRTHRRSASWSGGLTM
ncbi:MAG: DUF4276 family protein [Acidimicrobiia bacterium]|nr:DUF4276 family protein [Acidimicrobiia bacterium]